MATSVNRLRFVGLLLVFIASGKDKQINTVRIAAWVFIPFCLHINTQVGNAGVNQKRPNGKRALERDAPCRADLIPCRGRIGNQGQALALILNELFG